MRRSSDPLAGVLHERQWWDWRELRFKPTRHRSVRKSLEALAWKIDEASTRTKRQRDEEETRKEETRHAEEKARRQAEDEAARLLAEKERRFPRGRSKSISVEAKRKRQLKSPVGEMLNPDDRPAARRRVVLKPFTDEEKSARVRALADARRAHEEARRRSEANVQLTAKPAATSVKDTHRSRAKYHDPELIGQVTFNYSNNDGRYSIGRDQFFFKTEWSKADDRSIHLLSGPPLIAGIAEAPELRSYMGITGLASYDMSSRVRTIQEGEHAILKNQHSKMLCSEFLIEHADTVDELTFEFWVLTDTMGQT